MKSKIVSRKKDIDILFDIMNNRDFYKENSENGLVILINGSWGSGKTTLLKRFAEEIENNKDYELFTYYNSFSFDFYDNAYLPFFASIEDKLKLKNKFGTFMNSTKNVFSAGFVSVSYTIVNSFLKKKYEIDLNELKDNLVGFQEEQYLKDFRDYLKCKEIIINKMSDICKNKTQIIIVDELDRCKPSFAMETLEIIKHFFDVKNCIFVVAVDKLQLEESAKTIYGQEMDSEKYFSKFFDYQYNLISLNFNEIVDTNDIKDLDEVVNRATTIFNYLNVSSRDSKKIFSDFVYKYKSFSTEDDPWTADQSVFIIFLITLKYTDLLFYSEFLDGNYSRFKSRIDNDNNPISNNYSKLLHLNFAKTTLDNACRKISNELKTKYYDKRKATVIEFYDDENIKQLKKISKDLSSYIPQVKPDITFKNTINEIVN